MLKSAIFWCFFAIFRSKGAETPSPSPPLSQVKVEKNDKTILCIQPEQNVTATPLYLPSYLILSHSSS